MEEYRALYRPKTLEEHHAAFLFGQFCDYTLASAGEIINISDNGRARLEYAHLVHFFNTLGRNFFKNINNFNEAEFTLFVLLGISEYQDLQKIFSPENAHLYAATGYSVPYTSEEIMTTERLVISAPETIVATEQEDDEEFIDDPVKPRKKAEKYSGITRVRNQHVGIEVPVPIKESSCKSGEYFIIHGTPGPNDVVLAYPVEAGKTLKDYSNKVIGSSWKHPYLMALRHDYVERTGTPIQHVRKVSLTHWKSVFRTKYLLAKRKEKLRIKHLQKEMNKK